MDILSQRLPSISLKARASLSSSLINIITHLSYVIDSHTSALLSLGAIKTLAAVATGIVGGDAAEAGVLTKTIPGILAAGEEYPALGPDVLQTLNAYT